MIPPHRALVQADPPRRGSRCAGTILWAEHEEAWKQYARLFGASQSAERIAERGGYGYGELELLLGHEPRTWEPR